MVSAIRIYCEGGGKGPNTRGPFRSGLRQFFRSVVALAQEKRVGFDLIPCGSREQTYRHFKTALAAHPKAFNVLLVDAEAPVAQSLQNSWKHLEVQDGWDSMNCAEDHCYLMVQAMEAWFIADRDALQKFYGQGFNANSIPKNRNVEEIAKDQLEAALRKASKKTQPGEYQKIRHGAKLLARIESKKVRQASQHCDRLFTTLENKLK